MQFKIPQNVKIEDKIFAFISIKQLFIMLGGGGIAYVLFIALSPIYPPTIYLIPISMIMLLTTGIAFFRVDNLTFLRLLVLFLEQLINPQRRVWKHMTSIPTPLDELDVALNMNKAQKTTERAPKVLEEHHLRDLTSTIESEELLKKIESEDPTKPQQPTS